MQTASPTKSVVNTSPPGKAKKMPVPSSDRPPAGKETATTGGVAPPASNNPGGRKRKSDIALASDEEQPAVGKKTKVATTSKTTQRIAPRRVSKVSHPANQGPSYESAVSEMTQKMAKDARKRTNTAESEAVDVDTSVPLFKKLKRNEKNVNKPQPLRRTGTNPF